jgi:hypothetical protein
MKVLCEIEETELENEDGREVPGMSATCARCGHETESFGTGDNSRKRCLVLMREECPKGEHNFYVSE